MSSVVEVEQKIRAEVANAKAEGWKIVSGVTIDPHSKCCCALGAAGRESMLYKTDVWYRAIRTRLGIESREQTAAIAAGFDGKYTSSSNSAWEELGMRLRDLLDG